MTHQDAGDAPAVTGIGDVEDFLPAVRRLLASSEWSDVRFGIDQAMILAPDLLRGFVDGVAIDDDGRVVTSERWVRENGVRIANRDNAALLALSLQPSRPLQTVTRLDLSGMAGLSDLGPLEQAVALIELRLDDCGCEDLSVVARLPALRRLFATGEVSIDDLPDFPSECPIESLALANCAAASLAPLSGLPRLRSLSLKDFRRVKDLTGLERLEALERLSIRGFGALSDLDALRGLRSLRRLALCGIDGSGGAGPIGALHDLEELVVEDWSAPFDLLPLEPLSRLRALDLRAGRELRSLDVLTVLPALNDLTIPGVGFNFLERTRFSLSTLLRALIGGTKREHFADKELRAVCAGLALIDAFMIGGSGGQWAAAQRAVMRALDHGGESFRRSIARGVRRVAGERVPGDGTPLRALCDATGEPPWLAQALELIAPTPAGSSDPPASGADG